MNNNQDIEILNVIEKLNTSKVFPENEIKFLIEKKERSIPYLLAILRQVTEDYKRFDDSRLDFIVAFFILSEFRETKAFPHILKIASLPKDHVDNLLDTLSIDELPRWLASTFDKNLHMDLIKKFIYNESIDAYIRSSVLDSFIILFRMNKLSREEVLIYFSEFLNSDLVKDYEFTSMLIGAICDLHPAELYNDIIKLFDNNLVDVSFIDKDDVNKSMNLTKEDCLIKRVYNIRSYIPIESALKDLEWMKDNFEEEDEHVCNKECWGKISRNEPCPCGSNKKYKKCCGNSPLELDFALNSKMNELQ